MDQQNSEQVALDAIVKDLRRTGNDIGERAIQIAEGLRYLHSDEDEDIDEEEWHRGRQDISNMVERLEQLGIKVGIHLENGAALIERLGTKYIEETSKLNDTNHQVAQRTQETKQITQGSGNTPKAIATWGFVAGVSAAVTTALVFQMACDPKTEKQSSPTSNTNSSVTAELAIR